jgi:Short C-terminal domain
VRKPAVVQRVINSQINEIVGGGEREPIPEDMLPFDQRSRGRNRAEDTDEMEAPHTPPFGQSAVTDPVDQDATDPGRTPLTSPPVMTQTPAGESPATPPTAATRPTEQPAPATDHFDVRDRLIQLDDLRRRGIISEEEFAAKKTELLNRI